MGVPAKGLNDKIVTCFVASGVYVAFNSPLEKVRDWKHYSFRIMNETDDESPTDDNDDCKARLLEAQIDALRILRRRYTHLNDLFDQTTDKDGPAENILFYASLTQPKINNVEDNEQEETSIQMKIDIFLEDRFEKHKNCGYELHRNTTEFAHLDAEIVRGVCSRMRQINRRFLAEAILMPAVQSWIEGEEDETEDYDQRVFRIEAIRAAAEDEYRVLMDEELVWEEDER